ncbi:hypothetical protein EMMF5_001951 [Cystobasidiomycetes sp. EMM_F5]
MPYIATNTHLAQHTPSTDALPEAHAPSVVPRSHSATPALSSPAKKNSFAKFFSRKSKKIQTESSALQAAQPSSSASVHSTPSLHIRQDSPPYSPSTPAVIKRVASPEFSTGYAAGMAVNNRKTFVRDDVIVTLPSSAARTSHTPLRRLASRQSISALFGISPPQAEKAPIRRFMPNGMPVPRKSSGTSSVSSSFQVVPRTSTASPTMSEIFATHSGSPSEIFDEHRPFSHTRQASDLDSNTGATQLSKLHSLNVSPVSNLRSRSTPIIYENTSRQQSAAPHVHHVPQRKTSPPESPLATTTSTPKFPPPDMGTYAATPSTASRIPLAVRSASLAPAVTESPIKSVNAYRGSSVISGQGFKPLPLILPSLPSTSPTSPFATRRKAVPTYEPTEDRKVAGQPLEYTSEDDDSDGSVYSHDSRRSVDGIRAAPVTRPSAHNRAMSPLKTRPFVLPRIREETSSTCPSSVGSHSRKNRPPPLDLTRPTRFVSVVEPSPTPTLQTAKPSHAGHTQDDSGFDDDKGRLYTQHPRTFSGVAITPRRASIIATNPLFDPDVSLGSLADKKGTDNTLQPAIVLRKHWADTADEDDADLDLNLLKLAKVEDDDDDDLPSPNELVPRRHPRMQPSRRFLDVSTTALKSPPRVRDFAVEAAANAGEGRTHQETLRYQSPLRARMVVDASTQTSLDAPPAAPVVESATRTSEYFDWVLRRSAAYHESTKLAPPLSFGVSSPPQLDESLKSYFPLFEGTPGSRTPPTIEDDTNRFATASSAAGSDSLSGLNKILREQMLITRAISSQLRGQEDSQTQALQQALSTIAKLETENAGLLGRLSKLPRH